MEKIKNDAAKKILKIRLSQLIINERYKNGHFKIPIHLAFGHEAIAAAVDSIMQKTDKLVLSHRNIHYNLSRMCFLRQNLLEYYLSKQGLGQGRLGSMNLSNPARNIFYSSSILGNNFAVGSGLALGEKVINSNGIVIIVTGDGAIEEGSFYESLLFQKSNNLPVITIIENNDWSLATRIKERRCGINIKQISNSLGAGYFKLKGNDLFYYIEKLRDLRKFSLINKTPVCIEVELTTLGSWFMKTKENPLGKFINYHAGPAPSVSLSDGPIIEKSKKDPVYLLKKYFSDKTLKAYVKEILDSLLKGIE